MRNIRRLYFDLSTGDKVIWFIEILLSLNCAKAGIPISMQSDKFRQNPQTDLRPVLIQEGRPYGIWQPGYHSALSALDPMALRRRFSTGLPLALSYCYVDQKNHRCEARFYSV